jgi:maleylacetoacetate isomerase/maleylpyruvate isomerase
MARLYSYFRSSAAYRVRIALALKGIDYQTVPVHLLRAGGEQHLPGYRATNPAELVPAFEADGLVLTQSLAIIEYLEETCPSPALLPADAPGRARVRALAQTIACEIHPLNNLRVLAYLRDEMGIDQTARDHWYRHWVEQGLAVLEQLLAGAANTGLYCHGDTPTMADCCLVPQMFNAMRFDCRLETLPTVRRIYAQCLQLPAFQAAAPERQPDAE